MTPKPLNSPNLFRNNEQKKLNLNEDDENRRPSRCHSYPFLGLFDHKNQFRDTDDSSESQSSGFESLNSEENQRQYHSNSRFVEEESTQTDQDNDILWASNDEQRDSKVHKDFIQPVTKNAFNRIIQNIEGLFGNNHSDKSTQTECNAVVAQTEALAFDTIYYILGRRSEAVNELDSITLCMRKTVKSMLENHSLVFTRMVNRLTISANIDLNSGFQEMSEELFLNNEVSWHKIVTLFAFAARLAQQCEKLKNNLLILDVASNLSKISVQKILPFIVSHGGWSTLCDAFPLSTDYESYLKHTLLISGLGLAIIATIVAMQH